MGMREPDFPSLRQLQSFQGTGEQLHFELLLQRHDLTGKRGQRDRQTHRRAAKTFLFGHRNEIAKLSIYGLVDNELYISEEHYNSLKEKFPVPKASDIMISAVGTIGKCYIVKESDKFYYKDASVLCLCNDYQINAKYIYHIMRSEYMLKQMYDNSKGTTVDTITIEKAKQYILPLPPLAEQQRIVAKIEETFSIFDGIQNSLEA
mgnify:CR=1 FL=1